ncbi:Dihydroxyacid dehydratase [Pleurostoma richardsiae]|uniref:RBR-type E3 ubiquitin transferase n=1 Tax=Pleurostoma richardsiae TaxID=41990 RepID=A0AA38VST9_9PEZI|nr:Dihydroxyacid dehydratase [Pleurostoma richardsiae]
MSDAVYDLLIVTDATGSMGNYLNALNQALPEIIRISALTGCFSRIGVLAYRDYCDKNVPVTAWSGWYLPGDGKNTKGFSHDGLILATQDELLAFVRDLQARGGGDWREATKTGLAHAHEVMGDQSRTVMLLFADAPPHLSSTSGGNASAEQRNLLTKGPTPAQPHIKANPLHDYPYGGHGDLFADWASASNAVAAKGARVFGVINAQGAATVGPFAFLCVRTGGVCLEIDYAYDAKHISMLTVAVLLAWMGVEKDGSTASTTWAMRNPRVCEYKDQSGIKQVVSEEGEAAAQYFPTADGSSDRNTAADRNMALHSVSLDDLKQYIQSEDTPVADFSQRYGADAAYRHLVVRHLRDIIESDVSAITVNPVFGSLWRTVCNDRLNEARDELITAFGLKAQKMAEDDGRAAMKQWLEESYNYETEILEAIQGVAAEDRYPCVFLDPTEVFSAPEGAEAAGGSGTAKAGRFGFTRDELLEIGRSCDYRVLQRLGRVLTRLTYVTSAEHLPAHIREVSEDEVPRIPLALVQEKYKRKFWKVLLHTVISGTKLGARPAALLAALSLRMGMQPLRDAADAELLQWTDRWDNLDIPETWNTNCLALLLDADADFERRVREGVTARPEPASRVLTLDDRRLFETLVDYKMLEMNLDTTLQAEVGWRPEKTKVPLGPIAECSKCKYPRSVTIMAPGHVCGCCSDDAAGEGIDAEDYDTLIKNNVSADHDETTEVVWVECSMTECRAQYVIYNPEALGVRPKCHYCRVGGPPAPCVECTKCLSRLIWPEEYRSADFDAATFNCPACVSGRETVVHVPTTARALSGSIGWEWLLRNEGGKIAEPFVGRSLFYVVSTAGTGGFADKVDVLPPQGTGTPAELRLRGKLVRNPDDLVASLRGWVQSRRAEAGECSLCFSALSKRELRPACGRAGCGSRVCGSCLRGWYGLNRRGALVNVAALSCPFCRRQPTLRTVSGLGLAGLGGLRRAVEEAGQWVYGWCWDCGFARRFAERACAAGAPAEVERWRCEECAAAVAARDGSRGSDGPMTVIRDCPGCGTPTEKTGGCDHIECAVPGCGVHWCFFCAKAVGEAEIYHHMSAEHGGWYGGREFEEEEEFDEEEDAEQEGEGEDGRPLVTCILVDEHSDSD